MKRVCATLAMLVLAAVTVWANDFDWEKAVSLYKQGQFRAAIAEFQNVVAEFPNHADSWKFIGLAYYQLQEYGRAAEPLEKALALKRAEGKTDHDILFALGRIQINLKQYDKALPYLETITKQQPEVAANFYNLGVIYLNLNRTADAAAAFRAAVKLDPKDVDSWYKLSALQLQAGKLDDAISALRSGLAAAPKNVEVMKALAGLLLNRGEAETNGQKANAFYEEAIRVATALKALSDDATSAELLGRAFLSAKKYANAEVALEHALSLTKQPAPSLYFVLGFAHAQNKAWPRAAEMLVQADKLNPGNVDTLTYLGFVYENLRRYPQALDAYSRAYEAGGRSSAELKASIDRVTPFAKPQ